MLILYGGTWLIINNVVIKQQHRILQQYRDEKESLEYDYMKLKNYPDHINTIRKTIDNAGNKLDRFLWINKGYDPNLMMFQHISLIAEKSNLQIMDFQPADRDNEKYYTWSVSCKGTFPGILNLVNGIENSSRFLKIESIEITSLEDGISVSLKVSGIRTLE